MYLMRSDDDCGPAMLAEITGLPYETIIAKWPGGWRGGDRGRLGAPNDTPYDHFQLLSSLGQPFRVVTLGEILHSETAPGKTALLLHGLSSPLFNQHWALFYGYDPTTDRVTLAMGDGTFCHKSRATVEKLIYRGWPNCCYEVGRGNCKVSWWQRLVAKLTGYWV